MSRSFVGLLALTLAGCAHAPPPLPARLPAFSAQGTRAIASADLQGKAVILSFVSATCEPCQAELTLLEATAQAHAGGPVSIVAVDVDGDPQAARQLARARHLSFPLVCAPELVKALNIGVVPTTFVLRPDGRVSSQATGLVQRGYLEGELAAVLPRPEKTP